MISGCRLGVARLGSTHPSSSSSIHTSSSNLSRLLLCSDHQHNNLSSTLLLLSYCHRWILPLSRTATKLAFSSSTTTTAKLYTTATATMSSTANNNHSSSSSDPLRPVVFCGPSGVGKGTLIDLLMKRFPNNQFGFSVSHTTRPPRPGEEHGVHYNFTTVDAIQKDIAAGKFIEYAEVHGKYYGTRCVCVCACFFACARFP